MSSVFEVLYEGDKIPGHISAIFATTGPRGLAVSHSTMDATTDALTVIAAEADNPNWAGFLSRAVTTDGGPTVAEQLFGGRLESPDKATRETSVEEAEIWACEGTDYLEASTNPILVNSAIGAPLTFKGGKLKLAVAGDYAFATLLGRSATVKDAANSLRVIAKRCVAYLIPVIPT